jgi:hypothetical protein
MDSTILVPIHLDALHLARDIPVVESMLDYSRLPYFDGRYDINSDVAYISEAIVSTPFHNQNLYLKAGVHLHWALPDALTKAAHASAETTFPAVPTRWLVTRSRLDGAGNSVVEQRWVVESDYLYPEGEGDLSGSIAFPIPAHLDRPQGRPFRFLGRAMSLQQWLNPERDGGKTPEYLDRLTAAGYGHPAFAALYPNCRSVFGFYDPAPGPPSSGLQYDVIGWYSAPGDDHLAVLARGQAHELKLSGPAALGADALLNLLADEAGWALRVTMTQQQLRAALSDADDVWAELHSRQWLTRIDDQTALVMARGWRAERPLSARFEDAAERIARLLDDLTAAALGAARPERTICFARLRFAPAAATPIDAHLTLAVGNTGPEALAAWLATRIDPLHSAAVESQLEAILALSSVEQQALDTNPKLAEARHEKTFNAIPGETRWTISSQLPAAESADADTSQELPDLPEHLSTALAQLNHLQDAYDRTQRAIEAQRRQIFADWYKYLLCSYPPPDEIEHYADADTVRAFIELKGLAPLEEQIVAAARLDQRRNEAAELIRRELARLSPDAAGKASYTLREIAGPRYYQPTEPVALLVGDAVRPSPRYGQDHRLRPDGMLETRLLADVDIGQPSAESLAALWSHLDGVWRELAAGLAGERSDEIGFALWQQPPWHPLLLEWEVEFFPRAEASNRTGQERVYDERYITTNYQLDEGSIELALRDGQHTVVGGAEYYSGNSILTSFAAEHLRTRIARYLVDLVLRRDHEQFFVDAQIGAADRNAEFLQQNVDQVVDWYTTRYCPTRADDPVCNVARAYRELGGGFAGLSQALSGFNDALLMHRQTTQLPIADPLGFAEGQAFALRVREAVQRSNLSAPMPANDFNPIRAGALQISRLRLVDSFGQVRDVTWDRLVMPAPLREPNNSTWVSLPPRLAQPARLNLRWLAASTAATEAGAHPVTTPICGWLLPNHLDDTLMVYDHTGAAVGQIDEFAGWEPAPGAPLQVSRAQVHDPAFDGINAHLRRLIAQLTLAPGEAPAEKQRFLAAFYDTIEATLHTIEPEGAAQQLGLALLFGRPIAVVRATVSLELQGAPAFDQGWAAFDQDLRRNTRDSHGFTRVKFPIRIGAQGQFNDGVLGFWKERPAGYDHDSFYAVLAEPSQHERIVAHDSPAALIEQAIDDPPELLTLLIDPRGTVHATCGALPTKVIDIPPEQFAAALAALEVTFLTAPLITPRDQIRLSPPPEPGYRWSWLAPAPAAGELAWTEVASDATISKALFVQHFPTAQAIWEHLLTPAVRWLTPAEGSPGSATIRALVERKSAELLGDFSGLEARANAALGIDPATGAATASTIASTRFTDQFPSPAELWDYLLRPEVGWLAPVAGDAAIARIIPREQRPGVQAGASDAERVRPAALSEPFRGLEARIDTLFDLYQTGLAPMRSEALFTGPQEIREGWLKLRPAPAQPENTRKP